MNYQEAMEYIDRTSEFGSVLGLENTKELLKRVGNPQERLKIIHVAGTNGKGSVCAYIESILMEAGYRTGRFISPVLFGYREKIQIGSKDGIRQMHSFISEEDVAECITEIERAISKMLSEGLPHPTVFEIETVMSFMYFDKENCDVVVLEVGLGGRQDATNAIGEKVCAVITSIGMDHMGLLGDNLEQIASEKAGIILENTPVISYEQLPEAGKVIKARCNELKAPLRVADFGKIEQVRSNMERSIFDYKNYRDLRIQLLGEHQIKNAALAVEAAEVLVENGFRVEEIHIRSGLMKTMWEGRLEILCKSPYFVVDGAHNADGARALSKSLDLYFRYRKLIYLVGTLKDKEYKEILKATAGKAAAILTFRPGNERGLDSDVLAEEARKYCNNVIDAKTIANAIDMAFELAGKEDVILSFGSLSFIHDLEEHISRK